MVQAKCHRSSEEGEWGVRIHGGSIEKAVIGQMVDEQKSPEREHRGPLQRALGIVKKY